MSVQTVNSNFEFQLPSSSYIDVRWEEPNLRAAAEIGSPVRQTRPAGWLARCINAIRTWRRDNQAAAELAVMSDRELMDIGISRSDLKRVFEPEFNQDLRQRTDVA